MGLYEIDDLVPQVDAEVYLAPGCQVVGDVQIGRGSSVWFNSVVRGDLEPVRIGERTNLQDLCLVHGTSRRSPCTIGDDVTVGKGAVLHGCTIGDLVMVGMGAVILDDAELGSESIVAAQSLVRVGFRVPPRTLVAGVPAVVKRALTKDELAEIRRAAAHQYEIAQKFRANLRAAQYRPPVEESEST